MELTAGLATFILSVASLIALQRISAHAPANHWIGNEVVAGSLIATVVAGLGLGMLLLFYGADVYFHNALLDMATCIAILVATIVVLRFFSAPDRPAG